MTRRNPYGGALVDPGARRLAKEGRLRGSLTDWTSTESRVVTRADGKPLPGYRRHRPRLRSWRARASDMVKATVGRWRRAPLTLRQAQAFVLRRRGLTFAQIALRLRVVPGTAQTHYGRAVVKLDDHYPHWRCGAKRCEISTPD